MLNLDTRKLKSIELKHTNPSLGPYEKIITVSLIVTEEHVERIEKFLQTSQVNNTVSMHEYLNAVKNENKEVVNRVLENAPKGELRVGETISHLSFYFEDGQVIRLADVYRRFSVTHFYGDFTKYMVEKGTIEESELGGFSQSSLTKNPHPKQ